MDMTDGLRYRMNVHKMLTMPKTSHFFDAENRMKVCCYRQVCDKAVWYMCG